MPFINLELVRYMLQLAPEFDIVVPRLGQFFEPLHAVYSRNCVAPIESLIAADKLNVRDLFRQTRVRFVDPPEIERFDPHHLSFFNINTEADLERARSLLRNENGD